MKRALILALLAYLECPGPVRKEIDRFFDDTRVRRP